jgi:MSHA biogenesis protein MshM
VKKSEIGDYIAHRLRVAGYRGDGLFTSAAMRALHRASGGTPRLINILAHKSLLSVFGEGRQMAKVRHVRLARKDTEGARNVGWFWG